MTSNKHSDDFLPLYDNTKHVTELMTFEIILESTVCSEESESHLKDFALSLCHFARNSRAQPCSLSCHFVGSSSENT